MLTPPDNVAFSLFGLDVYYYGIFMGIAICMAFCVSNHIARKYYNYKNIVFEISPSVLLLGIIGARLYYCVLNWAYYSQHAIEILAVRNGGLSIHGALLLGIFALFFECKRYNLNFREIADIFVYGIPLGQSIARWGNFFNCEAFGYPTDLPWKLYIPTEYRPYNYINYEYFHPAFLYESLLDLAIFIILIFLLKNRNIFKSGQITLIYFILYSLIRIFVESFRIDSSINIVGIHFPIIVSIIIIVICTILYKRFNEG